MFSAPADGGVLSGWVAGEGQPVLILHGGPGMSFNYADEIADELLGAFRVANFQQRGLAPSVEDGPFTIEQALSDIVAVLDHLGWDRAYVVGHSWGGHLAFHAAVALPDRLLGVLSFDPLGAVGDGAMAAFEAEMFARTPEADRQRAKDLDEQSMRGEGTEADLGGMRLVWSAYFADPANVPPMPPLRFSLPASALFGDIATELPALEKALPDVRVPLGVLVGARSPMPPQEAGLVSAERVPGGWSISVPDAGHYPWFEAPGCVAAAMDRLASNSG